MFNTLIENEYFSGSIVGITQVSVGHPFDTIKTNLQYGSYKVPKKELLRGIKYPLMSSILSNVIFFGNYDIFYKYTNSIVLSGALSGLTGSFILNPFEVRKVRAQSLSISKNKYKLKTIYLGLNYTIARETFSNAIYFYAYHKLHDYYGINAFLSGGFAGINSWLWSYPLDVLKTRKQLNPTKSIHELIKINNLSNGLVITLIRGFLVNASSFYMYDLFKNKMMNNL